MLSGEEFYEILKEDYDFWATPDDNKVFLGLLIIRKYLPKVGVEAANHDVVYSVSANKLVEAGITKEDAKALRNLGWYIEEDTLAKTV